MVCDVCYRDSRPPSSRPTRSKLAFTFISRPSFRTSASPPIYIVQERWISLCKLEMRDVISSLRGVKDVSVRCGLGRGFGSFDPFGVAYANSWRAA